MRIALTLGSLLLLITPAWAAPQQRTRARAAAKGILEIKTPSPDSVIWLDGVRHGKADASQTFTAKSLAAGTRMVRVRTVGFQDWTRRVVVPAGKTVTLKVTQKELDDEAVLHLQKGDALREADKQDDAISAYRQALELRSRFPEAYIGLARSLYAKKRSDAALEAIDQALEQSPNLAEAHTVRANILRLQGDYEAAAKEYKTAIKLARGFTPEGHTGLALTYQEMDQLAEAVKELELGIKQNADTEPVLYQLLGSLYSQQNEDEKAIAAFEAYLKLEPEGQFAPALRSMIVQMKRDLKTSTNRP